MIRRSKIFLNDFTNFLISNEEKELKLYKWTLTETAKKFIFASISSKKRLEFWDCKFDGIFYSKDMNQISNAVITYLSFSGCKFDSTSLSYLLSIPTLETVVFDLKLEKYSNDVTDVKKISELQFSKCNFTRLVWRSQSNYQVFQALLKNKHFQQNLQDLKFYYPTNESKEKFDGKLIQFLRLKTIQIEQFKCDGAEQCPLADNTFAAEQCPLADNAPASEQCPLADNAPASEQSPFDTNTFAAEQSPLADNAFAADHCLFATNAPAAEQCPIATNALASEHCPCVSCEKPLQSNLTKFEISNGTVCEHVVEYLRKISSLRKVQFYQTEYETDKVKSDCEQLIQTLDGN